MRMPALVAGAMVANYFRSRFAFSAFGGDACPCPMLACVMVTVPANELIRRTVKSVETDPRVPAILEDDAWSTWLGEDNASFGTAKASQDYGRRELARAAPESRKRRPRKP